MKGVENGGKDKVALPMLPFPPDGTSWSVLATGGADGRRITPSSSSEELNVESVGHVEKPFPMLPMASK
jgi:hypothetical protein